MEKQLRCKDCKWFRGHPLESHNRCMGFRVRVVNPGQFACKKFKAKDRVKEPR